MSEPGRCPSCQSDQVAVVDSRRIQSETYRRRNCRNCGYSYSSSARTHTLADGIVVTVEAPAHLRQQSRVRLDRFWDFIESFPDKILRSHNS